jgi:hypothetical protein
MIIVIAIVILFVLFFTGRPSGTSSLTGDPIQEPAPPK